MLHSECNGSLSVFQLLLLSRMFGLKRIVKMVIPERLVSNLGLTLLQVGVV
jgi:hypothetical protein